ncbi:MAG: hypothetical protein L3K14_03450 [Thermoplasmata archaeon]|nr:hypothetical protein [Thermoplasmata archaeon]
MHGKARAGSSPARWRRARGPFRWSLRDTSVPFSVVILLALLLSALPPLGAPGRSAASPGGAAPAAAPTPGSAVSPLDRPIAEAAASAFATATHRALGSLSVGAPTLPPRLALSTRAPTGSETRAAVPSTANALVTGSNCTFEKTVATVANASNTIEVGATNVWPLFNGTFGTPCTAASPSGFFWSHGISGAFRSTNGGDQWTSAFLALNRTHWLNPSDPAYGSLNWGEPDVVSGGAGLLLYSDLFVQLCDLFLTPCNSSAGFTAPWGVAVARSSDGGASWSAPEQVAAYPLEQNITSPPNCQGTVPNGTYLWDEADKPWLTANPANGVAVLGWDVFHFRLNATTCLFDVTADVWVSVSHDAGTTWGAAIRLGGPAALDVQLAVGPAPTYPLEAVFADFANRTASGSSWGFTSSKDNGTTWAPATDVGSGIVHPIPPTAAPDVFRALTFPSMDVDASSTSSRGNTVYIVWNDNRTGPQAGYPGIDFMAGPNGGSSFIAPRLISPVGTSVTDYQPTVRVDPNGSVWVDYYGLNRSTGFYDVYGLLSNDGGATWSAPFRISSAVSAPGNAIVTDIGVYLGLVASAQGVYAAWTDCRSQDCMNLNFTTAETARLGEVAVRTNATSPVSLTVGTLGRSSSVPLPGVLGLDFGASVSFAVPAYLPYNATFVDGFTNMTGVVSVTTPSTTFVYSGGASLFITYVPSRAAFIAGTIAPAVAGVAVWVGGVPTPLLPVNPTTDSFNVTVAGGLSYAVTATAPKYIPFSHAAGAVSGATTTVDIRLNRTHGWIAGSVAPTNATVTVNRSGPLPVSPGGIFNTTLGWGWYWVNASAFGTTTSDQYVQVVPNRTRALSFALEGGWIQGTVAPIQSAATLRVDGHPVPLTLGSFNVSELGGLHAVVATAPGWNVSSLQVRVTPAFTTIVSLTLTDKGTVQGVVGPAAALPSVVLRIVNGSHGGLEQINLTSGAFRAQLAGGFVYTVNVTATNYGSYQTTVRIDPGVTSTVPAVTLVYTGCAAPCSSTPPPKGNVSPSSGNTLLYVGAAAGTAVLVVAAAVVLSRRRRSLPAQTAAGETPAPAPPPEELYGEGEPATLPHLRSDGTFEDSSRGPPPP